MNDIQVNPLLQGLLSNQGRGALVEMGRRIQELRSGEMWG